MTQSRCCRAAALAAAVLLILAAGPAGAANVGYAFTYQGSLSDAGMTPTGLYDFRCTLWDAASLGAQVGPTLTLDDKQVTSGVFAIDLDFGSSSYLGNARWLQVEVRQGASIGSYTLLPRQKLNPTPFAIGLSVPHSQSFGSGSPLTQWVNTGSGPTISVKGNGIDTTGATVIATNIGQGSAIYAIGNGPTRTRATLRLNNTHADGQCEYAVNSSTQTTAHFQNDGAGQVLWLQKDNPGNFIQAYGSGETKFWVDQSGGTHTKVLEILGGADLSEKFDVDDEGVNIAPGMVVSIDPVHEGRLELASTAYDHRVAGIISGAGGVKTGMLMGQDGSPASGKHPVALTGRVYCRATAANGPIQPGDLLTTSAVPGHCMRVDDPARAQGAILGKAMGSLAMGEGLILVLVGLQ